MNNEQKVIDRTAEQMLNAVLEGDKVYHPCWRMKPELIQIMKDYARARIEASLKEAAENATTKATYDYSLEVPEWTGTVVDKSSITNEKNIKLL